MKTLLWLIGILLLIGPPVRFVQISMRIAELGVKITEQNRATSSYAATHDNRSPYVPRFLHKHNSGQIGLLNGIARQSQNEQEQAIVERQSETLLYILGPIAGLLVFGLRAFLYRNSIERMPVKIPQLTMLGNPPPIQEKSI